MFRLFSFNALKPSTMAVFSWDIHFIIFDRKNVLLAFGYATGVLQLWFADFLDDQEVKTMKRAPAQPVRRQS
jgi:hypothetical protein